MPALSDTQKSQTRFHLIYNDGTPAGDRARLEKAINNIPDAWTVTRIGDLLVRCEGAYALTQLSAGDLITDERIAITGDVVRTTDSKNRETWNKRQRYYLQETTMLARALGVRNYRDPEEAIAGYLVDGGIYINSIPGPAGENGAKWLTGINAPALDIGESVGDFYLRTANGDIFKKTDEVTWTYQINIRGIKGDTGPRGPQGFSGEQGIQGIPGVDGQGLTPTSFGQYSYMYG